MGQITWGNFTPRASNRVRKLMLEKDEQARICFLEPAPVSVYIHTFEKVVTGPDGKPIVKMDQWPDGSPREEIKTEYAGKFRCFGDEDEIQRSGADPERCPACRAHIQNPNAVRKPTLRILGKVLKYSTKDGSFTLTKPFSAQLLVWDLTEKRFSDLNEIFKEHGPLNQMDLLLGPCEIKQMQKYTIVPGKGEAAYLQNDDTKAFVKELLQEERIDNLQEVAAKLPSEYEMEQKISEVVRAYNHAFGTGTGDYQSVLGENPTEEVAPRPKKQPAPVQQDDSDDEAGEDQEEAHPSRPKAPASDGDGSDKMSMSLDDLLNSF